MWSQILKQGKIADDKSVKISENEPYIITLDSLDSQYIYANTNNNMARAAPVWSCSQKNYYEFHVVTDSESDDDTDLNDVMKCQPCHICDVEVPVIFLNEHYNSEKHKLFQKLTELALERAARSTQTHLSINKRNITNAIYYCAPCSAAVLKENKWTHVKSKQHLKSQKNDEDMSSLIQMYINRDSGDINLTKYNQMMDPDHKMVNKNDNKKPDTADMPKIAEKETKLVEGNQDSVLKKADDVHKVLFNNIISNNNATKPSKEVHHQPKNVKQSENNIISNNNATKTFKEIHHEPKNLKQSEISKETYCKPCNKYIHTHNFLAHTKSKKHKSNTVAKNIEPTNTRIANDNENVQKINHLSIVSNPKELRCEVCEIILPNTTQNINEHIKTKKHKDNLLKWNTTNDSSEMGKLDLMTCFLNDCEGIIFDNQDTPSISLASVDSREDYCEVCKVKLPGSSSGRIIHESGKNHKANLLKS